MEELRVRTGRLVAELPPEPWTIRRTGRELTPLQKTARLLDSERYLDRWRARTKRGVVIRPVDDPWLTASRRELRATLAHVITFTGRWFDEPKPLDRATYDLLLLLRVAAFQARYRDLVVAYAMEDQQALPIPPAEVPAAAEPELQPETATDRSGHNAAAIPATLSPNRRPLGNAASAARRVCRGRAPPALSFRSR
jgi:hypothetical protein